MTLELAGESDFERLDRVFLAIRAALIKIAMRVVRDNDLGAEMAHEARQKAYWRVAEGLTFASDEACQAYLRVAVRRQALSEVRKWRRNAELHDNLAAPAQPTPEGETYSRLVKSLSPRSRLIVELRFVAGLGPNEIAVRLGLTPNYVSVILTRAFATLRRDPEVRQAAESLGLQPSPEPAPRKPTKRPEASESPPESPEGGLEPGATAPTPRKPPRADGNSRRPPRRQKVN